MTNYVGGMRARLVHDNVYNAVKQNLQDSHWLDPGRAHAPITVLPDQIDDDNTIEPNIVTVSVEDIREVQAEMGSMLTEKHWTYYIDVYAESRSFGLHLGTDIVDCLRGKNSHVSRPGPSVDVYDLSMATPTHLFDVLVDEDTLQLNRSRMFSKPWERHWWVISFDVVDTYANDQ